MSLLGLLLFKPPQHESKLNALGFKQVISVHSALKCHLYYTNFSQGSGVITEVGTKRFYDSTDDDCETVF